MRGPPINPLEPILNQSWPTLLLLFGLALIVDFLLGSEKYLGRLPGPDTLIRQLAAGLRRRLDRTNRSRRELLIRGVIVCLVILPFLSLLGLLLTPFVFENGVTAALTALALAFFMRQRRAWDRVTSQSGHPAQSGEDDQFASNRETVRALVIAFGDRGLSNLILFCVGGFALLLPYQFLRATVDDAAPTGLIRPAGPYETVMVYGAGLLAFPAVLVSSLLLSIAPIFVPATNLAAIRGMMLRTPKMIAIRTVPLNVVAHGLGLSFPTGGARDKKARSWVGPTGGTAKISALHLRRAALLVLVAWVLTFLLAFFLAGFALTA